MLLFALWVALGALVGSLVGSYRCSDIRSNLPKAGQTLHIGFCAGVGALAGFLAFFILASLFYGLRVFSN
jgi:hypothetical protein